MALVSAPPAGGGAARAGPIREYLRARPAAGLRLFVDAYSGYRDAGVAPARHRGLPSPCLTVIFTLDEPLVIAAHPDPAQPPARYQTLAGGLHTRPATITHDGWQSGIQLAMSPLGARALLGLPAGELASLDVDGSAVLGPLADQIQRRLQSARTWPDRFAVLDELLLARIGSRPPTRGQAASPEVGYAWRQLLASGGQIAVSQLAAQTGWSERHLRNRLREETGLTPKAAARVIRFHRARRLLLRQARSGARPALADVAACSGYYDQAHLDRDFGALAGCPPTTWLAQEFRNVQASPDEAMPGWQA